MSDHASVPSKIANPRKLRMTFMILPTGSDPFFQLCTEILGDQLPHLTHLDFQGRSSRATSPYVELPMTKKFQNSQCLSVAARALELDINIYTCGRSIFDSRSDHLPRSITHLEIWLWEFNSCTFFEVLIHPLPDPGRRARGSP
jgi:hypothetical protein